MLLTLLVLSGWMCNSCSTEFDVNAPYRSETVIYGLLSQKDTTHNILIRKSFLGEGNAYDYAAIADSSEYDTTTVHAVIEEWFDGTKTRSWKLDPGAIAHREGGDFYSDGAISYRFTAPDLNHPDPAYREPLHEGATFKLVVRIGEGANQKKVTAESPLVTDFDLQSPFSIIPKIGLANLQSSANNLYPSVAIKWQAPSYARRFEINIAFRYVEYYSATDSLEKELNWKAGSKVSDNASGSDNMEQIIDGRLFYEFIANNIPALSDHITKRVIRPVDFILTVAGNDLHIYMEVNEPNTGIVQERPGYTNIQGGRGIFSSRFVKTISKSLNRSSIVELAEGQYTGALGFCSDDITYSGLGGGSPESFYCD